MRLAPALLLLGLLGRVALAEADASIADDGRWMEPRGGASGSYHSRAVPIYTEIEEAWRLEFGRIETQPAHWDLDALRPARAEPRHRAGAGRQEPPRWERLFATGQAEWRQLSRKPEMPFERRWAMGTHRIAPANLFYEQAAATCHFLYHGEAGRHQG